MRIKVALLVPIIGIGIAAIFLEPIYGNTRPDREDTGYVGSGKCSSCHDPKEAKDKVLDLKNAYHKQCTPCHKKENEAGKKAPVKCLECHPKKQ